MSGMKIIVPTAIESAMLSSSTVPEPDPDAGEVAWNAATSYTAGTIVVRTTTHIKYKRVTNGTSATAPENDDVNWSPYGPTNRWAMFDRKIGTVTSADDEIVQVLRPGPISGLGALELVGREAHVVFKDGPGGTAVYDRTISLDGTIVTTVYEWLFNDYEQLTDFVLTDLPQHYTNGELTVEITGTSGVSVGVLQVGRVLEVGNTMIGTTVDIVDRSRKVEDAIEGTVDIDEGTFSKRINMQILTRRSDFNKIFRSLASLRAKPCIYIGSDTPGLEPLIDYAFYKSFSMVVAYDRHNLCNLEIEGLTR